MRRKVQDGQIAPADRPPEDRPPEVQEMRPELRRKMREKKYSASFIDQGYCFNAGEWTFPDFPLRGVYPRNEVYARVSGWESFEPWLSRIEGLDERAVWTCGEGVPPEWYSGEWEALERLLETLLKRRARVRELIADFRRSSRQPFPNWKEN